MVPIIIPELWLEIASYLSEEDIDRLCLLNRVFLALALNQRYRGVKLKDNQTHKVVLATIQRLRDPCIARLVRTVSLSPELLWDFLHPTASRLGISNDTSPLVYNLHAFKKLLRAGILKKYFSNFKLKNPSAIIDSTLSTPGKTHEALLFALESCPSVEVLEIDWSRGIEEGSASGRFGESLLLQIIPTYSSTLRSLSLNMPLSKLLSVLPGIKGMLKLEKLEVFLFVTRMSPSFDAGINNVLLPFINSHSDLKSLGIGAKGHLDVSSLFRGLRSFPLLTELSIAVPFGGNQHPSREAMKTLLHAHPLIHTLTVKHVRCCLIAASSTQIHSCLASISLPHLRTLEMGVDYFLYGVQPGLISALTSFSQTLTTMDLTDQFLSLTEVKTILAPFSEHSVRGRLEHLGLCVARLSPDLLDHLAKELPTITSLNVTYKQTVDVEHGDCTMRDWHTFDNMMANRQYTAWKLKNLAIYQMADGRTQKQEAWAVINVVLRCFPSVKSTFGKGYLCLSGRGK